MKIYFILLLCAFTFLLSDFSCSNNIAGGSSSTDNGKIIGTIVLENGQPAPHTIVLLLPANYNPCLDSTKLRYDTTDANGVYEFNHVSSGEYTIQALRFSQQTRLLIFGILKDEKMIVVQSDTLKQPGTIKIFLPSIVDSNTGYVFIGGTTFYRNFKSNIKTDPQGIKFVTLDSVPVASSLNLYYGNYTGTGTQLLSDTISVRANQVTEIVADINKPNWNFRIIAGVTTQTLQYFGNTIDSIKQLINQQMIAVNNNFNATGTFNGTFHFYVDSVYSFSTTPVTVEFKKPPAGYAFRLIYNAYGNDTAEGFYLDSLTAYHVKDVSNGDKLFGTEASDEVTWCFGLSRGGVALSLMGVLAANNPGNQEDYIVEESMMNQPKVTKKWDSLHINIFNHYKDTISITRSIVHNAFPPSMGVIVESKTGTPMQNVQICVYWAKWGQYGLTYPPALSGSTDTNGTIVFKPNYFKWSNDSSLEYPTLLVKAIKGSDSTSVWLPFTEVSNAWFKDNNAPFRKKIVF